MMKKSLNFLMLMLWGTTMAIAQPNIDLNFNSASSNPGSAFFGGGSTEFAHNAIQASDGSYICLGSSISSNLEVGTNYGLYDMWLYKYVEGSASSSYGIVLGGEQRDATNSGIHLGQIVEISPGEYGVVITTQSNSFVTNIGNVPERNDTSPLNFDAWYLRLTDNGSGFTINSSEVFGEDGHDMAMGLIKHPDPNIDHFFMIGTSSHDDLMPGGPAKLGGYDGYIMEIDYNGNPQDMTWSGGTDKDELHSIDIYNDHIYVAGRTLSSINGSGPVGSWDFYVAKYDLNLNEIWTKSFGSTLEDRLYDIKVNSNGIYLTGFSKGVNSTLVPASSNNGVEITNGVIPSNYSSGSEEGWVGLLDHDGYYLETRSFGGSNIDRFWALDISSANNVRIIGDTKSSDGDISVNNGAYDMWILETDANLNLSWERATGTTGNQMGRSIFPTSDGGFMAFGDGRGAANGDNLGSHNAWNDLQLVKFEGTGICSQLISNTYVPTNNSIGAKAAFIELNGQKIAFAGRENSFSRKLSYSFVLDDETLEFPWKTHLFNDRSSVRDFKKLKNGNYVATSLNHDQNATESSYSIGLQLLDHDLDQITYKELILKRPYQTHNGQTRSWVENLDYDKVNNEIWVSGQGMYATILEVDGIDYPIDYGFFAKFDENLNFIEVHIGDVGLNFAGIASAGRLSTNHLVYSGFITTDQGSFDKERFLIGKMNPDGSGLQKIVIDGNSNELASHVIPDNLGGFFVCGYTYSSIFNNLSTYGDRDMYIAYVNSSFNIQWQTIIGGSGEDRIRSIKYDQQNNELIIGGETESSTLFTSNSGSFPGPNGDKDYFLGSLNASNGFENWIQVFGGSNDDFLTDLEICGNGQIYMAGITNSTDGDLQNLPTHFNPNFRPRYWLHSYQAANPTPRNGDFFSEKKNELLKKISIFPNPSSGNLNLSSSEAGIKQVRIFNSMGMLKMQNQLEASMEYQMDISEFRPGIYMMLVEFADGSSESQRIIKE